MDYNSLKEVIEQALLSAAMKIALAVAAIFLVIKYPFWVIGIGACVGGLYVVFLIGRWTIVFLQTHIFISKIRTIIFCGLLVGGVWGGLAYFSNPGDEAIPNLFAGLIGGFLLVLWAAKSSASKNKT